MQIANAPKIPKKFIIVVPLILLGTFGTFTLWRSLSPSSQAQPTENVAPKVKTVTALGYLEPQGKVIKLAAPSSSIGGNSRVEKLLVKQGDQVKAGQVIAILDSRDRLEASLLEAEEQVNVALANLEVVKSGAKRGEINSQQAAIARIAAQREGDIQAQRAAIARLQMEVQNAQTESQRYEILYKEGATNASLRDSKRLALAVAQRNLQEAEAVINRIQTTRSPELNEAQSTLDRISEVRAVDVMASQAQVDRAIASLQQAKAQLDLAYVRTPQAGVVLEVNTRAGELVSSNGIVEIGKTDQMLAVLEVFEGDIVKVEKGKTVKLFGDSLPKALTGEVVEIGERVQRQNVVNSDTTANIDARVVEVRVKLDPDSASQVRSLTNLQVTGEIQL
ncbi:HlyD family efflux transporter periplasmic adaptor subunit [Pseudanabaena mucicola]|uniref:Biotin/lipoyl-binding protein n=1 Tax=Pseudanabaena mucicola FACHB-723 TaxID=2692860 RepID=A0ABR8A166_9CYAN|nr:HlyD family efflux transporter periplasmic adaptor subunit [Pseudanabaena mucicola]MBD2189530.1 biotin/lipoyl-binding protein [Pseudanabaena mucicola FACHB-723]